MNERVELQPSFVTTKNTPGQTGEDEQNAGDQIRSREHCVKINI